MRDESTDRPAFRDERSAPAPSSPPEPDHGRTPAGRTPRRTPHADVATVASNGELAVRPGEVARRAAGERLLLVSTNYAPEPTGIGPYAAQTAEHLAAERNSEVHVLAGLPHYPAWRTASAYRGTWCATERRAGVYVHRRRHVVPSRQTAARRALYEGTVLAHGLLVPPSLPGPPHAVLAQLPTLAGGVLAARLARRHRVPFVPIVQDLMGAAAAQSGIAGGGRAAVAAAAVESRVLRSATLVGVIHDSFRERVCRLGVPESRVRLVPNWAHGEPPAAGRERTRERLGWPPDRTVLLHAGAMGLKQGLEVLVEAARRAPELLVVLMGDGSQRATLARRATGLANVRLLAPVSEAEFPDVLAAADLLALTQRASVTDMSVPSKLTAYCRAGRPVVASVAADGGTAAEVRRSGAGTLVSPEDPEALAVAARDLAADPDRCAALGARGVGYARTHLDRGAGLARVTALLDEALERHRGGGRPLRPRVGVGDGTEGAPA